MAERTYGLDQWFSEKPGAARADAVCAVAGDLATQNRSRIEETKHHTRLYSERDFLAAWGATLAGGSGASSAATSAARDRFGRSRGMVNGIRQAVNAATNMVARARPMPAATSQNAGATERYRSKKRQRALLAWFHREKGWHSGARMVKAGNVTGHCSREVYSVRGEDGQYRIRMDLVHAHEQLVDDVDGALGDPQTRFKVRPVSRVTLARMYPKHAKVIDAAPSSSISPLGRHMHDVVDTVDVCRLASVPGGSDGHRVLAIRGAELSARKWTRQRHPYSDYRWEEEPFGFWGCGIPYETEPLQREMNSAWLSQSRNVRNFAPGRVFLNEMSGIKPAQITNRRDMPPIYTWTGAQPPIFDPGGQIGGDLMNYIRMCLQMLLEQVGIPQLWAQAQQGPATSGRAKNIQAQQDSLRHKLAVERYTDAFLEDAYNFLAEARDLAEAGHSFDFMGAGALDKISYEDIALADDMSGLQFYSMAFLGTTIQERIDNAEHMMGLGILDAKGLEAAAEVPHDLSSLQARGMAPQDYVDRLVEKALLDGVRIFPDDEMDLAYAFKVAVAELQLAGIEGVDQDKIDALREFKDLVQAEVESRQPAAPNVGGVVVSPAPAGPGPVGVPMPPGAAVAA